MEIPFYNNMTNKMKEVADFTLDETRLKEEFILCHKMFLKATEAYQVSLPHTTETNQPVVHGAKRIVNDMAIFWEIRRDAVKQFLPKEWVESQGVSSFSFKR